MLRWKYGVHQMPLFGAHFNLVITNMPYAVPPKDGSWTLLFTTMLLSLPSPSEQVTEMEKKDFALRRNNIYNNLTL